MQYRADIDGLRAISVIAVIMFHAGTGLLSGGYVGVDIFFVISGYLITGLVFDEIKSNTFTFVNFYKRRIARLLPALIIVLFFVFMFGFLFYDNQAFDSLGKKIFFSAIGAANILFAQGVNYFAQEDAVRPLIHLWSLGVEEQFYLVWPTVLMVLAFFKHKNILIILALLFFVSFFMAVLSVSDAPISTYFYPQYRAFELIIGGFTALVMRSAFFKSMPRSKTQNEIISFISLVLIVLPMFLLDEHSTFPGLNTLYPCIGAALFIAFAKETKMSKLLSISPLVFIGLISYPLYLYHQPIISYIHFFHLSADSSIIFLVVLLIAIPLAWLTYRYAEKPIRSLAHKKDKSSAIYTVPLLVSLAFFAVLGIYVAKNNGVAERFQILNPFAYAVSKHDETTFHAHFTRGMNLSKNHSGKILFVGDSLLQQYVYPLSKALGIDAKDVDAVTRGGCVLVKGVAFLDTFSDISCNDLREELYNIHTQYEYVVFSQSWDAYDTNILNVPDATKGDSLEKWTPFIEATIKHFKPLAKHIIMIGAHIKVEGTSALSPTIFLSEQSYRKKLNDLKVTNVDEMLKTDAFFNQWKEDALIIHPIDIWSQNRTAFYLHDEKWSFFADVQHASQASTDYLEKRMKNILK